MARRPTNAPETEPTPDEVPVERAAETADEPVVEEPPLTTSWGDPLDPVDGWPIFRDGMSRHRWFAANREQVRRDRLEAALADPDAPPPDAAAAVEESVKTTESAIADASTQPAHEGA